MTRQHKVRFLPIDRTVYALRGESILDAAMQSGVYINGSCGGNGTCGRCKVTITSGEVSSSTGSGVSAEEHEAGIRLACVSYPITDITVAIPLESQIDRAALRRSPGGKHLLTPERVDGLIRGWSVDPPILKKHLKLLPPTLEHNVSDATRLLMELKKQTKIEASLEFDALEGLSRKLREADWNVTVTLHHAHNAWKIRNVEGGDRSGRNYAVAVDIGTTTVCAQLLDIAAVGAGGPIEPKGRTEGRIKGESADYNGQIGYGEDVISRIMYSQKPDGLKNLQASVIDTVNRLIDEMVEEATIDIDDLTQIVLAGNTTMIHLILALDPKYLMLDPYVPVATDIPYLEAERIGLRAGRKASVRFFPSVASYVGGAGKQTGS